MHTYFVFQVQTNVQNVKNETQTTIKFAVLLFILVGGMWLLGYIILPFVHISPITATVLAYIIAISNSFQGKLFII